MENNQETGAQTPQFNSDIPKIAVAIPAYGGKVYSGFAKSLNQLCLSGLIASQLWLEGDSHIDRARNTLVASFLATDCQKLLFLDSDLIFQPGHVARLVQHDKPLVCGIYPKKKPLLEWVVNAPPGAQPDAAGLVEATCGATGFMLIDRSVFEKMLAEKDAPCPVQRFAVDPDLEGDYQYDFFKSGIYPGTDRWLSEDYYFSQRWVDCGGKIHVDTQCQLQHIGGLVYPLAPHDLDQALTVHEQNGYQRTGQPVAPPA